MSSLSDILTQVVPVSSTYALNSVSMVRLNRSTTPSDCGRYGRVKCWVILFAAQYSAIFLFLNSVPLSDNNVLGLFNGNAMSFSAASFLAAVLSSIGLTHAYRVPAHIVVQNPIPANTTKGVFQLEKKWANSRKSGSRIDTDRICESSRRFRVSAWWTLG